VATESKRTVMVALAANLAIAVAKLVAGLISGSSSMLAEAAHSVADTLNQVFLLTSLRVSQRAADPEHPFGYGKAQYFWSLIAAASIFVAGAVFSLYEGLHTLLSAGSESTGVVIAFVVLGVSFVAEGTSWLRAVQQLRREAQQEGRTFRQHVRLNKDPSVTTVLAEDSAALVGLLLAAGGVGLHHVTGDAMWDGVAAVLIGLLLALVAFVLGRDVGALIIGESAQPALVVDVYDRLTDRREVSQVVELLTMHLGPAEVLVAVRLDLDDALTGAQVEHFSNAADRDLRAAHPEITQVFLDATRPDPDLAARTAVHVERLRASAALDRDNGPQQPREADRSVSP
jgi:cation diffusion facilitator family transporter